MLTRDTPVEQPILIMWVCAPFIIVISKDAVSLVAATFGPYNAGNAEESTPKSETPVLMGWRKCDLEMLHHRPRRNQWVVDTLSRRSDQCGSKSLKPNNSRPGQ